MKDGFHPPIPAPTDTEGCPDGAQTHLPSSQWWRKPTFLVAIVALPFFLLDLGFPALNDGEAMYAEIAREMRLNQDWITPRLNETRHFDKPPFTYWVIALNQMIIGESEVAARFWQALAAWGIIPVVAALGRSLYGMRKGWLPALIYATSIGMHIFGRLGMPDALLCFWIALAILGYARCLENAPQPGTRWMFVMCAALGFATLTKGLVGLALPLAIIGIHMLLTRRLDLFSKRQVVGGAAVVCLISLPWYLAVGMVNPDFAGYFIIREHVMRFTGGRYPPDESVALPLFLVLTLLWTFPWVSVVPQALIRAFRRVHLSGLRGSADLLPLIWILVFVGLFSASRSRLEYYALPAVPALALLVGKFWDDLLGGEVPGPSTRALKMSLGIAAMAAATAATGAWIVLGPQKEIVFRIFQESWPTSGWVAGGDHAVLLEKIRLPAMASLMGVALFLGGAFRASLGERPGAVLAFLVAMMAPLLVMVHWGFLVMEPFQSSKTVAQWTLSVASPEEMVIVQEPHEHMWIGGITYYLKRPVHILKDPRFEGIAARRREPPERFLDDQAMLRHWTSPEKVVMVTDEDRRDIGSLLRQAPQMHLVGGSFNRKVVVNRKTPLPVPSP
ncbi:MAG: glycosyltransferase family 39 protein [Deltaproteobacteria bacterium]|nr:glycosyltransferase family 39 protein [Deltaproteobacteria bacterium]